MIFFYFLKIIFDISTSKRSKKYKPHSILAKKKNIQNLAKRNYKRNPNSLDIIATARVTTGPASNPFCVFFPVLWSLCQALL
jgi:hypothetical protein